MKTLLVLLFTFLVVPAAALELSTRRIEVASPIDSKAGAKLAADLMKLDEAGNEPIYLLVTASGGSAQGVMLAADAIRAVESPVVAVVLTSVQGAGAALPLFADRVVMLPSAELVFTEVDYEGVAKPPEAKPADAKPATPGEIKAAEPKAELSKSQIFLQKVRTDYLARFWVAVARRLGDTSGAALEAALRDQGGKVVTAQEALQKKLIFEVVGLIETQRVPTEKTELKVTTTRTQVKTAPPAKALRAN